MMTEIQKLDVMFSVLSTKTELVILSAVLRMSMFSSQMFSLPGHLYTVWRATVISSAKLESSIS